LGHFSAFQLTPTPLISITIDNYTKALYTPHIKPHQPQHPSAYTLNTQTNTNTTKQKTKNKKHSETKVYKNAKKLLEPKGNKKQKTFRSKTQKSQKNTTHLQTVFPISVGFLI